MKFGNIGVLWITTVCFLIATQPVRSAGKDTVAVRNVLAPRSAFNHTVRRNNITKTISGRSAKWINEVRCGKTADIAVDGRRIIGGRMAVRGQWPWMVMIWKYYYQYDSFSFTCGGTLIKKQWVLTAAHCFNNEPIELMHVVLGAHRRDLQDSSVRRFAIAEYFCHNLYVGAEDTFKHDICLVKLAGEAIYTDYIKPICLPISNLKVQAKDQVEVAGWGETQDTGDNSVLQVAKVDVIDKQTCDTWYAEDVILPEDHLCAGFAQGKIDSCQGDSGGPLVKKLTIEKDVSTYQFGIVSFGIGCANAKRPGVYTKVSSYTEWIASTIEQYTGSETCYNAQHLVKCESKITESGTAIRTPIVDQARWLYPANTDCSWEIEAPEDSAIFIKFDCFFHTEIDPDNSSQCYDYMRIKSATEGVDFVYCNPYLPEDVNIAHNKVTVYFHSDSSVQSSGFMFRVHFTQLTSGRKTGPDSSSNSTLVNETVQTNHTTYGITDSGQQPVKVSTKQCVGDCNSAKRNFSRGHFRTLLGFVLLLLLL